MNTSTKIKRYSWTVTLIMAIVTFGIAIVNASADQERIEYLAEETEIRELIRNYFDKRYRSRSTNQIEDLRELTDNSPQSNSFLLSETDKLEIEIYNAEIYHLRYSQYEYFLDFNNISINTDNQTATVSLIEGHDVVFEISEMIAKTEPIVSKMRNLEHTIILKKNRDGWKIISDYYDDLLWRMIRASNLSKDDMLLMVDSEQDYASILEGAKSITSFCNLPDDESTHPYNRSGAVAYAHRYAEDPNPAYHYFTENDCTNFINQAIHHGSNAEEVGSNTYGWY